jgi:hypothetical protein
MRGTDLGVWGGRGSLEQGVPWRRKLSGGERQWWSRGAAEGTGKGVEGAHDVGVELGTLTGCSERGRTSGLQCLNDGKHGGVVALKRWRRKKGVAPRGGGAPFIADRCGWQRRHEMWLGRWRW